MYINRKVIPKLRMNSHLLIVRMTMPGTVEAAAERKNDGTKEVAETLWSKL